MSKNQLRTKPVKSFSIDPKINEQLKSYCEITKISASEIINECLEIFFSSQTDGQSLAYRALMEELAESTKNKHFDFRKKQEIIL